MFRYHFCGDDFAFCKKELSSVHVSKLASLQFAVRDFLCTDLYLYLLPLLLSSFICLNENCFTFGVNGGMN